MKGLVKLLFVALLGGGFALVGNYFFFPNETVIIEKADNKKVLADFKDSKSGSYPNFSETASLVTPAVVHIRSAVRVSQRQLQGDPFRDFFGFQDPNRGQSQQSSGSGVIINEDGYIVTNNHVIDNADEIEVSLNDNRTYKAKVIGTDPTTDLALIKIEESNLPKLLFGNSDEVQVGEWVLAVGNPFNLESTVTAGIVSAKSRNINILRNRTAIESFIQTDAAVNPGNSGGALVNLRGELIGINTAIATPTGSYAGYSFAVPTRIVSKVVEDLMEYGTVQRAFLGVSIQNLDKNNPNQKGVTLNEGVFVAEVQEGGAADRAGIQKGDVIIKINDEETKSVAELQQAIGSRRPGETVKVVINRGGDIVTLERVELKNGSGNTEIVRKEKPLTVSKLGAEFEELSQEELEKLGIPYGIRVKKLQAGVLRSQTEIREGFIITKVNRNKVRTMEDLNKEIENTRDGGVLVEGIYPDNKTTYFYGFGLNK